jgi:hypothetical protein
MGAPFSTTLSGAFACAKATLLPAITNAMTTTTMINRWMFLTRPPLYSD